jgi:hypothetical protein
LLLSVLTVAANGAIRSGRSFRRSRPARKFLQRGEHDLPVPPRSDLLADLLVVFREFLAEVVHRQDDPSAMSAASRTNSMAPAAASSFRNS